MSELLRAEGLCAFYGASQILFGVDLALREQRTLALLGRNGAGKSTTMKTLAGIVPARSGRILFADRDITRAPAYIRASSASLMCRRTGRSFPSTAWRTIF